MSRNARYLALAAALVALAFGPPLGWQALKAHYGAPDLKAAAVQSTLVTDRHGALLNVFTMPDGRWRMPLRRAAVDPRFLPLLEAYEDRHFATHGGVDWVALARAAGQFLLRGHIVSGGSTLAMQVVRLLHPGAHRTFGAKLRQIVQASMLEHRIGRRGVLRLYLRLAPYGGNIEGLRAACLSWFGHEPHMMSMAEMALLVALPQSPQARRPDLHPKAARRARARVLARAVAQGLIGAAAARRANATPLPRHRLELPHLAPHAALAALRAAPKARVLALTLDRRLQKGMEALARAAARRLGPHISVAMLMIDNATGDILAHVGSPNALGRRNDGALDMTTALRSPGSSLKPFYYAMAFERGLARPGTMLDDRPTHYGIYAPLDFDRHFAGEVSVRDALAHSLNLPSIAILSAVGPQSFLARLKTVGVTVRLARQTRPGLSVGLGGLGIDLVDLARLYCGLARGGSMIGLRERQDQPNPVKGATLTSPAAAAMITDILRDVPPPRNAPWRRLAYKTGTSYGYRDALAIGFDQRVTIAVWVGRPDNGATPGLIGRDAAGPLLFSAFSLWGHPPLYAPASPDLKLAMSHDLPQPLRRLSGQFDGHSVRGIKIAYPPDGARIDLDLHGPDAAPLMLKAEGGAAPFTWLVNGVPIRIADQRHSLVWTPDGAGFARVSVEDARGHAASVEVRLE
ncbi:MAG: penicillin-binding protein 1C [Hyphomicrobiales bacterium]|nr:penicillin-binding protein 1C [Hyphomicrobiales bacterium]